MAEAAATMTTETIQVTLFKYTDVAEWHKKGSDRKL